MIAIHAAKADPWYQTVLDWATGTPLRIFIIVISAVIVQVVLNAIIRRIVKQATERAKIERLQQSKKILRTQELSNLLMTQRTEQRAAAIGSLLRSIVGLSVWGIAMLMILPLLGVDIAPLLASAGVVGVALGFGAQTLVKDYLSGIFLIVEDQIGVGDVVDLGSAIGSVEEVALRYTRLRDASGIVWYVRNGEILRVGNRSQGWTLAVVDIPVDYAADIDQVRDLINAVGQDMDDDPAYDDMLLGAPTFTGVESVTGNAVVVRVTAKSVPEMQLPLARVIRERVKLTLDRAGIVIPAMPLPTPPPPPNTPPRP